MRMTLALPQALLLAPASKFLELRRFFGAFLGCDTIDAARRAQAAPPRMTLALSPVPLLASAGTLTML